MPATADTWIETDPSPPSRLTSSSARPPRFPYTVPATQPIRPGVGCTVPRDVGIADITSPITPLWMPGALIWPRRSIVRASTDTRPSLSMFDRLPVSRAIRSVPLRFSRSPTTPDSISRPSISARSMFSACSCENCWIVTPPQVGRLAVPNVATPCSASVRRIISDIGELKQQYRWRRSMQIPNTDEEQYVPR